MPYLEDMIANIERAINEIEETRAPEGLRIVSNDGMNLMQKRVIETGTNAAGQKFSSYSDAVVPTWMHGWGVKDYQQSKLGFNAKDKSREMMSQKGYFTSYKDWRNFTGRPTDYKNFSFSNALWESVEVVVTENANGRAVFDVRSTISEYQDTVIPAQSNREGIHIFEFNESEIEWMVELMTRRILRILTKYDLLQ